MSFPIDPILKKVPDLLPVPFPRVFPSLTMVCIYLNIMGDKLLLNFGLKFPHFFIMSHVKLPNCHGNVSNISVPDEEVL